MDPPFLAGRIRINPDPTFEKKPDPVSVLREKFGSDLHEKADPDPISEKKRIQTSHKKPDLVPASHKKTDPVRTLKKVWIQIRIRPPKRTVSYHILVLKLTSGFIYYALHM